MRKKGLILSILFLFFLPLAFAAGPLDRVYELIGDITAHVFFDFTTVSTQTFTLWMKTLLFFVLFALYSLILPFIPLFGKREGSSGTFHAHAKKIGMIVSFALALISVVMIPASILAAISSTYGFFAAALFLLAPLLGIIIGLNKAFPTGKGSDENNTQENKHRVLHAFLHALAYYLFATILHNFTDAMQTSGSVNIQDFTSWSLFIEGLALIAFIVYLILAIIFLLEQGKDKQAAMQQTIQQQTQQQQNSSQNSSQQGTRSPPTRPRPTVHPSWQTPSPKHDPTPPTRPQFPEEKEISPQPLPPQTRHVDVTVDLSPGFLPIKNQQGSSACAAFSANAIIEYYLNYSAEEVKFSHELSELFLWYYGRTEKNVNRGIQEHNLRETLILKGICFEPFWTWDPADAQGIPLRFKQEPDEKAAADGRQKKIKRIRELPPNDPDTWVDELQKQNPLLLAIDADEAFYLAGMEKRLYYKRKGRLLGGHAIVLVGFTTNYPDPNDPSQSIAAFKIRNSWGKGWGEEGYLWITRDLLPQLLIWNPLLFEGLRRDEQTQQQNGLGEREKELAKKMHQMIELVEQEKETVQTLFRAEKQINNEKDTAAIALLNQRRVLHHAQSLECSKGIEEDIQACILLANQTPQHEQRQMQERLHPLQGILSVIRNQEEETDKEVQRLNLIRVTLQEILQTIIQQNIYQERRT